MHLCSGENFYDAYATFNNNSQLIAIGINCTSPFNISSLLKSVKQVTIPFIVYSNDGRLWDSITRK